MFKKLFAIPALFAVLALPQLCAADYSMEVKGDKVPLSSRNITVENGALKIDKNSFARIMCELPAEQGTFTCEAVFEPLPMPAGVARHTSQVVSFVNKANRRTNADFVINQYARDKRPFFVFMIRQTDGKFLSVGEFYQITPGQKTVICAKWDKDKLTLSADGKLLKTVPRKLPFLNDTGKMVINKVGDRYPMPMKLSRIAIAGSDPAIAAPMTYAEKKDATLAESKVYKHTYIELPCTESIKNIPAANGMLEFGKGKYLRYDSNFPGDEGAFIFEAELDLQPMDQNLPRRASQVVSISDKGRTIADFVINQYPKNEQPYFVFMLRQSDGKYFSVGEFGDFVPGEKTIVCASWNKKNVKLAVNGKVLKTVPVKTDFIGGKGYMIVGNPHKTGRVSVPMKVSRISVLGAKPVPADGQKKN